MLIGRVIGIALATIGMVGIVSIAVIPKSNWNEAMQMRYLMIAGSICFLGMVIGSVSACIDLYMSRRKNG